jgi:hypothetical protein
MRNIPEISKAEVEARRKDETIEAAVVAVLSQGATRSAMMRGQSPDAGQPERAPDGRAYFRFGQAFPSEGALLMPS